MQVDRFLKIISAIIGFFGAILLVKGILYYTPDLIAKLSMSYWGFSPVNIQNLSSQKADILCGGFLILLAFLTQIFALVFIRNSFVPVLIRKPFRIFENYWPSVFVAVALSLLVVCFFFAVNRGLSSHYEKQTKRLLAKWTLEEVLKEPRIGPTNLQIVEQTAELGLGIKREPNETWRAFLQRLARLLEVRFPADIEIIGEP